MANQPEFLYRYRPATSYAIEAVLKGQTYAVCPCKLNDRLDCSIRFDLNELEKRLLKSKKMRQLIIQNVFLHLDKKYDDFEKEDDYFKYSKAASDEAIKAFHNPASEPKIKEYINRMALDVISDFQRSFAVVCYCSAGGNQIMWSHYASDSAGFVLGYSFDVLSRVINEGIYRVYGSLSPIQRSVLGLHPVTYPDTFPDGTDYLYRLLMRKKKDRLFSNGYLDNIVTEEDAQFLLSLLTQKQKGWSYEGEYRLILPFGNGLSDSESLFTYCQATGDDSFDHYYFDIGNLRPFAIVLGEKMSLIHRVTLAAYCKTHNHVLLFQEDTSSFPSKGNMFIKSVKPDDILQTEDGEKHEQAKKAF